MSGVTRLREEFIGTQLVCSRSCSDHITTPTGNFSRYLKGVDLVCSAADLLCEDINYEIQWATTRVKMIPTPGHSPGSICIVLDDILFSGDTLIWNRPTVTRLPGGRQDQLKASIAKLVDWFPPSTVVFPGHGEPFLFGEIDQEVVLGVVKPRYEGARSHLKLQQ
jgi:glyoxylase-like metal-dependent hydrolase (beta-lactamase superfamily II)